jgi:competence protein ComEA
MQPFSSFSRAQLGIILLLGALLLVLYAWRGNFGLTPSATSTVTLNPVFVEITGEVARPGVYSFPAPPTLPDVWRRAGGPEPLPQSDTTISSGSRVEVTQDGAHRLGRMAGPRLLTLGMALDVNTATTEDLEALPGIGPVLAQRIVQYRQSHGLYKTREDLLEVSGIGKKKLAELKPYLAVLSPPKPSGP